MTDKTKLEWNKARNGGTAGNEKGNYAGDSRKAMKYAENVIDSKNRLQGNIQQSTEQKLHLTFDSVHQHLTYLLCTS
jgi:hypothetical protein